MIWKFHSTLAVESLGNSHQFFDKTGIFLQTGVQFTRQHILATILWQEKISSQVKMGILKQSQEALDRSSDPSYVTYL